MALIGAYVDHFASHVPFLGRAAVWRSRGYCAAGMRLTLGRGPAIFPAAALEVDVGFIRPALPEVDLRAEAA